MDWGAWKYAGAYRLWPRYSSRSSDLYRFLRTIFILTKLLAALRQLLDPADLRYMSNAAIEEWRKLLPIRAGIL
jgi:hypothetical protein